MNSIKLGGILCAAANGFYAGLVLIRYSDDPNGGATCVQGNYALLESDASQADSIEQLDYSTFVGLCVVNGVFMLCGKRGHDLLHPL